MTLSTTHPLTPTVLPLPLPSLKHTQVRNPEVQYKAITFYVFQHPLSLGRLLQVLTPHLDHARTVHLLRKNEALPLAVDYMRNVQKENLSVVNEALNGILVLEEDFEGLRSSIDDYDNFDQLHLAQKVRAHTRMKWRREREWE
jgi:clathrin heavy chain